jgi:hypothetical protein
MTDHTSLRSVVMLAPVPLALAAFAFVLVSLIVCRSLV